MENVKLKMTNDELSRALETTSQELALAQDQLSMLQDQAARLQQEKEMWGDTELCRDVAFFARNATDGLSFVCVLREMYRVTEGLQREKQSLMKQLDLLRYNHILPQEGDAASFGPLSPLSVPPLAQTLIAIPCRCSCKVS